jgi:hypothetical protein
VQVCVGLLVFVVFEALEKISKMLLGGGEARQGVSKAFIYTQNFPVNSRLFHSRLSVHVDDPLSLFDIVYKFRLGLVYVNLGRRLAFVFL